MLIRPLIARELLRECRHRAHFISRVTFVLVLGLLVAAGRLLIGGGTRETAHVVVARYGAALFGIWVVMQYLAACVFTTVRAASLADEHRTGRLSLVRITCLQDSGVILGWFTSIMGRAALTMMLALPVLVIARSFGGFTMAQVGLAFLATMLAAAHAGAFTLIIASLTQSTAAAVSVSLILQILSFPAVLLIADYLPGETSWLHSVSLLEEILKGLIGFGPALYFAMTRIFLILIYLGLAADFPAPDLPRFGRSIKRALLSADRFFIRLARKTGVLWREDLGRCREDPIMWRERAVSLVGQRDHMVRIGYCAILLVIAVLMLVISSGYDAAVDAFFIGSTAVPVLFFAAFLVMAPATAFVRERQHLTLPLLAVTPLSSRRIVRGKYLFCLSRLAIPAALFCVVLVLSELAMGLSTLKDHLEVLLPVSALILAPLVVAQILYVSVGSSSASKSIAAGAAVAAVSYLPLIAEAASRAIVIRLHRHRYNLYVTLRDRTMDYFPVRLWNGLTDLVSGEPPVAAALVLLLLTWAIGLWLGPGTLKRTVLAVVLGWSIRQSATGVLRLAVEIVNGLLGSDASESIWLPVSRFVALVAAVILGTGLFLHFTDRQLDRLMERYG